MYIKFQQRAYSFEQAYNIINMLKNLINCKMASSDTATAIINKHNLPTFLLLHRLDLKLLHILVTKPIMAMHTYLVSQ